MATLTNTKIKDTYDGLLKTTDNEALDVSGVTLIEDGLGNASALSVGRSGNGVTITGSLNATLATAAQPNITSVGTLSSLAVSGNLTVGGTGVFTNTLRTDNILTVGDSNTVGTKLIQVTPTSTSTPANIQGIHAGFGAYDITLQTSGGNVGIGKTPSVTLDVNGVIQAASGANYIRLQTDGSNAIFDNSVGAYVFRSSGFAERMRIDSSGNVGINVNPSVKLDVYRGSSGVVANFNGVNAYGAETGITLSQGRAKISGFLNTGGAIPGSNLRFYTMPDSGSVTERMRITSGGDVQLVGNTYLYANPSAGSTTIGSGFNLDGSNNLMTLWTNDTERMRITSGGFLKASNTGTYVNASAFWHELVSSTEAGEVVYFRSSAPTNPYGITLNFSAASPNNTSNYFLYASDSTAARCIIWSNGNIVNANNSYGAISDAKLKENVTDASPKLDDLLQVRVRNFNYIGDDKKQLGVVAQELEEVFPSMIDESPDFEEQEVVDEEGNVTKERVDLGTTTKSVKYSVFVPMLIKAMQEQQEIINDLKSRIETLEAK